MTSITTQPAAGITTLSPYRLSSTPLTMRRAQPKDLARVLYFFSNDPSTFNCHRAPASFAASIEAGHFLIVETDERQIVFASGIFTDSSGQWLEFGATKAAKSAGKPLGSGMRLQRLATAAKSILLAGEARDPSRVFCSCLPHNSPSLRNIEASGFKLWADPAPGLKAVYGPDRPTPVFYRLDPGSLPSHRAYVAGVVARGYVERRVRETPLGPVVRIEIVPMRIQLYDHGDKAGHVEIGA